MPSRGRMPRLGRLTTHCMKHGLLISALLLPSIAKADVIQCAFTEPFMRTSYDTSLKRMTVTYDVEKRRQVLNEVSLREITPGVFEFRNANGQALLRMQRTCRGSDGMSDRVYPYDAQWMLQNLSGGCTSTRLKSC